MDDDQQFCLRWNNHQSTLISVFDTLLENETLVDCTLAAEGKFLKAHKVVLSACSPYFATLLQEQYDKHPIFILKDVKYQELRAMMDYMYRGEVNISQDQLAALLKAAESLQIKGLSDNRTGSSGNIPKQPEHHRGGLSVPGGAGKLGSGYTLEHTKRARIGQAPMDVQEMSGSREGSSSPSRRRRKARRRSIENAMTDVHDNSNSSQHIQVNQSLQQSNANLAGVGAITAAASALATHSLSAATLPSGSSASSGTAISTSGANQQQLTTSVTKKTETVKGTSDAMNTENVQAVGDEQNIEHKNDKQNHKQQKAVGAAVGKETSSDLVIEPKSEYDEEGNEETVEDLTLDDEDIGMDDLDQNAGTSQGGEGSSQGYAPWQHERSQEELLLATQEAQQRDPQDLSKKENTAPRSESVSVSNTRPRPHSHDSVQSMGKSRKNACPKSNRNKKSLSMSEVSDKLYEFYNAKRGSAPKTQQKSLLKSNFHQTSPTSAETHEPSTIAATNGALVVSETASKNLQADEMTSNAVAPFNSIPNTSFHLNNQSNKIVGTANASAHKKVDAKPTSQAIKAIPTSVLVTASPQIEEEIDIKPAIDPTTGLVIPTPPPPPPPPPPLSTNEPVIRPVPQVNIAAVPQAAVIAAVPQVDLIAAVPQAAAIAAALIRDGYHNFQQQLRAQEILKHHTNRGIRKIRAPVEVLEAFLRQQRVNSLGENESSTIDVGGTDSSDDEYAEEDDSRFDDIQLDEERTNNAPGNNSLPNTPETAASTSASTYRSNVCVASDFLTEDAKRILMASQAQSLAALRNMEYSMNDGKVTGRGRGGRSGPNGALEANYECCICGKKYRWKSTLRRHESVECGGKLPSHKCPYCSYKSKQRGNLGVHVRKHHPNLPQLESKRRSKYSRPMENVPSSASDDSSSKVGINYSK